jgi:REP element-mobilizing transposase RayT
MVLAYHLIWTAYGWWLPNDPRGSISHTIRRDVLRELGELHFERKRLQPASRNIRTFYDAAREVQHDLLTFSEFELGMIANCFADVIRKMRYTCYACAIMPDHIHLVIRKHRDLAEVMIHNFQMESRAGVLLLKQRFIQHPVWGGPGWKVFLNSPQDIKRTIKYVEDNPIKARLAPQSFEFVTEYDGWPFHKRRR